MRIWLGLTSLVLAAAALPSVARADAPDGSVKLTLKVPKTQDDAGSLDKDKYTAPTTDVQPHHFNRARCECDEAGDTQNVLFDAEWVSGMQPMDRAGTQIFAWAGSSCASATSRDIRLESCSSLEGIPDAITIDMVEHKFVGVGDLLTPGTNHPTCESAKAIEAVTYGLYTSTDSETSLKKVVEMDLTVDMKPPPVPMSVTVLGQEGQIALSWEPITSDSSDIKYFQALCATAGGGLAHDAPTHEAQYDTVDSVCGGAPVESVAMATITNDMQQMGAAITSADLGDLAYLDKLYVCGQASGTAKSITLENLTNGAEYMVVLASMDKAGNPSAVFVPRLVSPQPVTDFWEDANAENPDIEGGLCLVESTYGAGGGGLNGALRAWRDELSQTSIGRWFVAKYYAWGAPLAAAAQKNVVARIVLAVVMAPFVAVALVWHAIGLPAMLAIALALVWLRRRRKLVITAIIALAPSIAAAQTMTPYWDDDLSSADTEEATGPKWHFGLRLGPYTPSIDSSFMSSPGPYERMFGDGSWMPALDLHRVFGTRFGQIGGGLSVGYFGKTADAYIPNSGGMRAEGNENSLKIIPFEATAIYRATQLHDNYRVPLVPYLRGGLGYYLWWVRRPDGDFAKACPANLTNCDRAIGASLGLVGAVGLAIRAEGIDPSAARSMRDSGLDHAGFYAELEMGWVDGFGSAKKLSLGDTTWSAGIDFEF